MSKRNRVCIGLVAIAIALIALLAYSLERTAWLFELFERDSYRAMAAAVVVEVAAVALLAGAAIDEQSRKWANGALVAILSTQVLGNLSAGYLEGWDKTATLFGSAWAGYIVATVLWLVANLAVPGLVLCLSKLLERQVAILHALPPEDKTQETAPAPFSAARPALAHRTPINTDALSVPVADRACRHCHETGLTATEVMRHGKAYKKNGVC